MEKKPIGLIIKEIVKKNNLNTTRLAKELDLSRQQVYNTFTRNSMHEGEIIKWAKVLNVPIEDLSTDKFYDSQTTKSVDNGMFGSEVLQNIQKLLEEELKEKNDQIRSLQEALKESQSIAKESQLMAKALLGKSHESPNNAIIPNSRNGQIWLSM